MAEDSKGRRTNLENFLNRLSGELWSLSDILTRGYFSHVIPSRQLSTP
jgi:hypothetical protein